MILVIGGAYQGKTEYVIRQLGVDPGKILSGKTIPFEQVSGAVCIKEYQLLVKRLLEQHKDPVAFTEQLIKDNPEGIILLEEIGCGIIPMEKQERIWREMTGRVGCIFAARARTVVRIQCGIPTVIKGGCP